MWRRSLSGRLILTLLAWSGVALLATGVILVAAYRESIEQRFDETLNIYEKSLIAEIAELEREDRFGAAPDLREPRFNFPLSGWYWMILTQGGEVALTSNSLAGDTLAIPPEVATLPPGHRSQGVLQGPDGAQLRYIARAIRFEEHPVYVVVVAADPVAVREDTARFRNAVVIFLSLSALGLVAVTLVQVRIGLRPLEDIRRQLQAIHAGRASRLEGEFPQEIAPLAAELNSLIDSNRAVLERARHHVGNLAHAVKTPLSIVLNEARGESSPLARSVEEQALIMQRQVRHYLERAQMAAKRRLIGAITDVSPTVDRLARVIARLHRDKRIEVRIAPRERLKFAGEQQDFEEMLGNLLENAAKWASGSVVISAERDAVKARGTARAKATRVMFTVTVEDDGPGLDEAEREAALSRGERLDATKPGSGLGLSIVNELAELYGGALTLDRSAMGGLRARLLLPMAQGDFGRRA